jgi:hypothetical protein
MPTVHVAGLAKQLQAAVRKGKRRERGQGEGPAEEEKDATLKYVMQDLARELYIELLEGFHRGQ